MNTETTEACRAPSRWSALRRPPTGPAWTSSLRNRRRALPRHGARGPAGHPHRRLRQALPHRGARLGLPLPHLRPRPRPRHPRRRRRLRPRPPDGHAHGPHRAQRHGPPPQDDLPRHRRLRLRPHRRKRRRHRQMPRHGHEPPARALAHQARHRLPRRPHRPRRQGRPVRRHHRRRRPRRARPPPRRRRRRRDRPARHHRHPRGPRHAARHRARTAEKLFVPFTVGGGIRSAEDAAAVFNAGADKVSINSSAIARPELIGEIGSSFGAQAVIVAIDARAQPHRRTTPSPRPRSSSPAAASPPACASSTGLARPNSAAPARSCSPRMDADGTRAGFDCELTAAVSSAVQIPVIASGGAGSAQHFAEVFSHARRRPRRRRPRRQHLPLRRHQLPRPQGRARHAGIPVRLPC